VANSLTVLIEDFKKLLGLLNQVDSFAKGGTAVGGRGGVMSNSLSPVTTVAPGASGLATAGKLIGVGLTAGAGFVGGASSMMPDVAMTIGRASGFYGAAVASGGLMGTAEMDRRTRLGLGQFQNIPGGSAKVAGILAGRGMVPGSATFSQTVTSVGQAARYLNMPNDVAASAIEGLTSGSTSMMMLRNFGVFTSNPVTGQAMTQGQIFEQLASRWTGGRQTSVEGTMESLRRGNLGSNIRNSGLDTSQQALLAQYMIDRSRGINMDLSDPNAISEAERRNKRDGIVNPLLDAMRLTSKDDELMSYATESYQAGMKKATDGLIFLADNAVKPLIDTFGELKATMDVFMGHNIGGGAVQAVSAVGGGLLGGAMIMGKRGGGGGGGKGSIPASGKTPGNKGGFKPSLKGFGASAVAGFAGGMLGNAISSGSEQGSVQSKFGNALAYGAQLAGLGGMIGSFFGPGGTAAGAVIGGVAGLTYGAFTGGQEAAYASNSTSGGSLVGNINPGNAGAGWRGGFGEKRYYGSHQGIDIPLAEGTKVYAAADGKVTAAQSGSGPMSYGLYVKIQHSDKYVTFYAHLSRIDVKVGQEVAKGQIIGLSGNTGFSTGPHLHFGLFRNGTAIDPSGYLSDDLTGGVERHSAGNNGGKSNAQARPSTGGSIVDLVVTPGASITAASSSIMVTSSGVKGRSVSTASVVAAGMAGGLTGLSSPALGSMGGGTSSNSQTTGTGGGLDVFVPVSFTSVAGSSQSSSNTMVLDGTPDGKNAKNNVVINVSVAQASETEARRFAKLVKEYLDEDKTFQRIGRK